MNKDLLSTVILPDDGFMNHIRMALSIHMDGRVSFETLARDCLCFSWHMERGIEYNHCTNKYPALDYVYFNQVLTRYGEILSAPSLNACYIELRFHRSLENGLEFMVNEYLPRDTAVGRFA
ncbi:hypothetical protein [Vibrio phage BONAISHI]|nr:hypothetical protein [Vibrio phage BONAISHI]